MIAPLGGNDRETGGSSSVRHAEPVCKSELSSDSDPNLEELCIFQPLQAPVLPLSATCVGTSPSQYPAPAVP